MVKVAINGFGRIGRNVLRGIIESGRTDIEVVAINDLGSVEMNAHLFRYDSTHGPFPGEVKVDGNTIDEQFDINPPRGCDPLDDRGNHSGTITEAGSDAGLDEPEDLVVRSPRDPRQRDRPAARRSRTSRRSA